MEDDKLKFDGSIHGKNPPKAWWPGDERVERYMPKVKEAIIRHIQWPSDSFTDIYNRCYEAIYQAIKDHDKVDR